MNNFLYPNQMRYKGPIKIRGKFWVMFKYSNSKCESFANNLVIITRYEAIFSLSFFFTLLSRSKKGVFKEAQKKSLNFENQNKRASSGHRKYVLMDNISEFQQSRCKMEREK